MLTPQEFDLRLREIRLTRNLLIFFGFIPIIHFFAFGVLAAVYRGAMPSIMTILSTMSIIVLAINTTILYFINRLKIYINRTAIAGLVLFALGLLAWAAFWRFQHETILWIAGSLVAIGTGIFFYGNKTSKLVKTTNISYYVLMLLQPCLVNLYGDKIMIAIISISTVAYPMLASYAAVKWANTEFFKLTNN
ncbi:MAG: hypothetical protein IJC40_05700 [Muribaculaceae bacterium]|nr:hypothetical protein [Muribaculaceae bacterium]